MPTQEVTNDRLESHLKAQDDKIDKLIVAVDGNGKPGLRDRVRDLEANIERFDPKLQERVKDLENCVHPFKRFIWIFVGAVVVNAVGGLFALLFVIAKMIAGPK